MPLKKNFNKRDFKILGNCTLYDPLKGPSLKSPIFLRGRMDLGMLLATTSSNATDTLDEGRDATLSNSVKSGANDENGGYYRTTWGGARKFK